MKVYLASGYGVISRAERELAKKYQPYRRLISYHDKARGNHIEYTIEAGKE